MGVAVAVGAGVGAASFRYGLKGSYFALVTLAFAEVFRILTNSVEFTGGGLGMLIPMKQTLSNFQFGDRRVFYFIILSLTVASVAIALWLKSSRFGARLAAIRENEDSARALGIHTFAEKIKILMISGAIAGVGGCFFAQYFLYIDPTIAFGVDKSVEMLLVSMIGGAGTVSISVTIPSTAGFTYSVYIGAAGSTTMTNLGLSASGPTVGPMAGQATQLTAGATVIITGAGEKSFWEAVLEGGHVGLGVGQLVDQLGQVATGQEGRLGPWPAHLAEHRADLIGRLREAGLRPTRQRVALARLLFGAARAIAVTIPITTPAAASAAIATRRSSSPPTASVSTGPVVCAPSARPRSRASSTRS